MPKPRFLLFGFLLIFTLKANSQQVSWIPVTVPEASSFRALSIPDDETAWVAGNKGLVGQTADGGKTWDFKSIEGFEKLDFRSLYAFDKRTAIVANAGSPAYILRTENAGKNWSIVYENQDSAVFIDGIDFWDAENGLIYGDPINGKLFVIKTTDSGKTWNSLPASSLPTLEPGEASFAASGTNIRCFGKKKVLIASGGSKSRLFYSTNAGNTWRAIEVPIIQGKNSEGIFGIYLVSDKHWIVVGGDYTKENQAINHIFYTLNGGKNWEMPKRATGGYRECVAQLENEMLIAVGPQGADISLDRGLNWVAIDAPLGLHVIRKSKTGHLVLGAGRNTICTVNLRN